MVFPVLPLGIVQIIYFVTRLGRTMCQLFDLSYVRRLRNTYLSGSRQHAVSMLFDLDLCIGGTSD